jgi:predicted HTH transcriptional regulator
MSPKKTNDIDSNIPNAEKRRIEILHVLHMNNKVTVDNLSNILSVSRRTVLRDLDLLRMQGKLERSGDERSGSWIVKDL